MTDDPAEREQIAREHGLADAEQLKQLATAWQTIDANDNLRPIIPWLLRYLSDIPELYADDPLAPGLQYGSQEMVSMLIECIGPERTTAAIADHYLVQGALSRSHRYFRTRNQKRRDKKRAVTEGGNE